MSHAQATEAVIEIASQLKGDATRLFEAYTLLPQVIEKEHRAIKALDMLAVQETGDEKAKLGERIEEAFRAMHVTSDQLGRVLADLTGEPRKRLVTLKECVEALEQLATLLADQGLGAQVLRHLVNGLKQLATAFDEKIPAVKPLIEANKHLLQTMLESYQESYRFWQQVAEETTSSYNAQGVQKAAGRNSAFRAKA